MIEKQGTSNFINVIVWDKEVEVRGLPLAIQTSYEKLGAFWSTRGLRMSDQLFQQLEAEHAEFSFLKHHLPNRSTNQ